MPFEYNYKAAAFMDSDESGIDDHFSLFLLVENNDNLLIGCWIIDDIRFVKKGQYSFYRWKTITSYFDWLAIAPCDDRIIA